MRRVTLAGLFGAGLIAMACGGPPASGPLPVAPSTAGGSTAAPIGGAAGATSAPGSEGVQADALAVFDALNKMDEAFAAIGLAPFKLHAGRRSAVIVGGRMQRTALGEQPLQEDSQLSKGHEALGLLWGARNRTIRLEFDGGRTIDARPDASKSAAEKLTSSSSTRRPRVWRRCTRSIGRG